MSSTNYPPSTQRPTFTSQHCRAPQKIALEEAVGTTLFNSNATLPPSAATGELPYIDYEYVADIKRRLLDVDARVKAMDHANVALTIVSLTMPGIEGILNPEEAVQMATKVNDEIHQLYSNGPHADRFRAFGCVAMQDPTAAATEAERCIRDLGCVGVLVNGFSNLGDTNTVQYLDEPACEPFWDKLEELDVPLYLHPRISPPNQMQMYRGYEFLAGSPWGFGVETATHVLRLMISGLFDRHPRLKIILGHCGEGLPFSLYRVDHRLRHFRPENVKSRHTMQHYWHNNFWVTTAGVMSDSALEQTIKMCGEERVMWSVDYPYEDYDEIGQWFDCLEMSKNAREKIGWRNAIALFNLNK